MPATILKQTGKEVQSILNGTVRYNSVQELTLDEQKTARENIGATNSGDFDVVKQQVANNKEAIRKINETDLPGLAEKDKLQDTEIAKKADAEAVNAKNKLQDTEIAKKADITVVDAKNKEQDQKIEALISRSDVVDVVADKATLDAYDISKITINDVIKVLKDESRNDEITYYRLTSLDPKTWSFIGTLGEVYTQEEVNALLAQRDEEIAKKLDKTALNEYNISMLNSGRAYTLAEAITALSSVVPDKNNVKGLKLTFIDSADTTLKTYMLEGPEFMAESSWSLIAKGSSFASLLFDLQALLCGIDRAGKLKALSLDSETEITVCGYPLVVFGKGAPSAEAMESDQMKRLGGAPAFRGQRYIDITAPSKGEYYAVDNKSVKDWRN